MGTDAEVEEPIPTKDVESEEELYDRREYDGDNDFWPALLSLMTLELGQSLPASTLKVNRTTTKSST
jgi:hypothetical protein